MQPDKFTIKSQEATRPHSGTAHELLANLPVADDSASHRLAGVGGGGTAPASCRT
jgi:hypothetical protein